MIKPLAAAGALLWLAASATGCQQIDQWLGSGDETVADDFADPARADPPPAGGPEASAAAAEVETGSGPQPAGAGVAPAGPMQGFWRFTDRRGVVHYVDSLDKVPRRYRRRAVHPEGGSYTIVPATPVDDLLDKYHVDASKYAGRAPPKATRHGQVILYSTSWCPYCKKAAAHLRSKGVAFVEKDVGRSKAALQEMLAKSGGARGVPVIDVHGQVIRGFNPRALDAALGR